MDAIEPRPTALMTHRLVGRPDGLCRYAGEEFAVVTTEMVGNAMDVAGRPRRAVAHLAVLPSQADEALPGKSRTAATPIRVG